MIDVLDELIEEMLTDCSCCRGTGIKLDSEGQCVIGSKEWCIECSGSRKVLSYKGENLMRLIKERIDEV